MDNTMQTGYTGNVGNILMMVGIICIILQKRKLKGLHLPKPSQRLQWVRASLELKGSHPDKETDEPVVL